MAIKQFAMAVGLLGLMVAVPAAAQDYAIFSANLFGKESAGGGPAANASADFNGEADIAEGQLCYYFEADGLDDVTGAAINEGGKNGQQIIPLQVGDPGSDEVCTAVASSLLAAIAKKPRNYTIVIYTAEFPEGALSAKLEE